MRNRRAFTLVEMLVVVAIMIAVLAILVPALDQALAVTEVAHCQSNMRQIMYASIQYAATNRQSLPQPNWLSIENGGADDWTGAGWLYKWNNRGQLEHNKTGALWPYMNDLDVYHCIAHPKPWGDGGRTTEAQTSYVMNGSVCDYGGRK
ncbi:MAG: type II secretion system GspH family protein, partial [Phycisphaerae bacterium]|nr:type II secretion system GspH family protein [Phycisphaerae bacterium]